MIELDGSYKEGGGQIVRSALSLSAITGQAFRINNIRKNRPGPGLKNQHLFGIKNAALLCNASYSEVNLGSESFEFIPRKLSGKSLDIDIKTAGSITLLLQSILFPAMFASKRSKIRIIGGTDVAFSPPIDYFANVLLPHLKKYADIKFKLISRGFYPKGGGSVELLVTPKFKISEFSSFDAFRNHLLSDAPKINLNPAPVMQIKGVSVATSDLSEVAQRQADSAIRELESIAPVRIQTQTSTNNTSSSLVLWAVCGNNGVDFQNPIYIGGSCLGRRGLSSEDVGKIAAKNLRDNLNSGCDFYLADQLIPLMALVGKSSIQTSKVTDHTKTNIFTTEKFLGKLFDIKNSTISCEF